MGQLDHTIFTYFPANSAFDSKRMLLRGLFFFNEDRTKYLSVDFCPARDYQILVEFRIVWIVDGSMFIILNDEQVGALAEGLPNLRDAM